MCWSDVFAEFECRHNCILEKLELDKERIIKEIEESKSAKEIAADAATNSAAETADWENPRDPIGAQDQLSISAAQPNQSLIPN